jgi:FSR family fosmidomycin resistance protein-like MFS transporter
MQSEGASVWRADITLAIYQMAGVAGALLGGTISDRLGRKPVLFAVTLLAPLMVIIFLRTTGWIIIPVLVLSGIFALSSQPITLSIVQDHFPNHRSIGNGFFMAFTFICLGLSSLVIGMLADRIGLSQAFQLTAFFGLLAAPIVFFLPPQPPRTLTIPNPSIEDHILHG